MDKSSIIGVGALLAIACVSGCGSSESTSSIASSAANTTTAYTGSYSGTGGLNTAVQEYRAGHYREAQRQAERVMTSGGGTPAEASYVAGLSALRQKDLTSASRLLNKATSSSDPELASKAKASLGIVRLQQQRYDEAARLLQSAAGSLDAFDAKQARRYASAAIEMNGSPSSTAYASATRNHGNPRNVGSIPGAKPGANSALFSLQVGNFVNRENADRAATEAGRLASSHRMGPVRTVPGRDHVGRRRYVVQFGEFNSRIAAASARNRLGRLEYIVAPRAAAAP